MTRQTKGARKNQKTGKVGKADEILLHRLSKPVSKVKLASCFHMSLQDASKKLDICETTLQKYARVHGVKRWPHRKIAALLRKEGWKEGDEEPTGGKNWMLLFGEPIEAGGVTLKVKGGSQAHQPKTRRQQPKSSRTSSIDPKLSSSPSMTDESHCLSSEPTMSESDVESFAPTLEASCSASSSTVSEDHNAVYFTMAAAHQGEDILGCSGDIVGSLLEGQGLALPDIADLAPPPPSHNLCDTYIPSLPAYNAPELTTSHLYSEFSATTKKPASPLDPTVGPIHQEEPSGPGSCIQPLASTGHNVRPFDSVVADSKFLMPTNNSFGSGLDGNSLLEALHQQQAQLSALTSLLCAKYQVDQPTIPRQDSNYLPFEI